MKVSLVLLAMLLGACSLAIQTPEKVLSTSNQSYPLNLLFTDEAGNKIYRFHDQGDYRYYVVGPSGAQMLPSTRTAQSPAPPLFELEANHRQ